MKNKKEKKITLYLNQESYFKKLSNKQAGKIIKMLFAFCRIRDQKQFDEVMRKIGG